MAKLLHETLHYQSEAFTVAAIKSLRRMKIAQVDFINILN
jgi:hypothetical protein